MYRLLSFNLIFHTFILSNFNFCPLSWHFCSEKNTKKIEKVQERAIRFVYFDYTSSQDELLVKVKLHSLHVRRARLMAIETFKIINGIAPSVLDNILQKRDNRYNFRYSNILQVPQVRTTSYVPLFTTIHSNIHHIDAFSLYLKEKLQRNHKKPSVQ